jgi:deoxyribodipyrimidine photo-lyase
MSKNSLFIFHRDLRKEDNIGLIRTITESNKVFPVFIFTPDQVSSKNKYKSDASVQFMVNSLKELEKSLSISFFYNDTTQIVKSLLSDKKLNINHVAFNRDFTPYAKKRDGDIIKIIKSKFKDVSYEVYDDVTLNPPDKCLKKDGNPYRVYTPYYKNASKFTVDKPLGWSSNYTKKCDKIAGKSLNNVSPQTFYKIQPECVLMGGRKEALKILSNIKKWNDYNKIRNIPIKNTTRLSAHLKFGTVSPREVYYQFQNKLGPSNELFKQLYWRDFYMTMLDHYPNDTKSVTNSKMNNIKWSQSKSNLKKWQKGMTGIPLVDAGMRELNETGFMHNRVRMVVATFLIYNLGLNWVEGERYFSKKLVDVDRANNLGNWKWVAGIESYSNDYYKAMSMESQMDRFDPDAKYVKQWVPELEDIPANDLIKWEQKFDEYDIDYPDPIVNTKESRKEMIEKMKKAIKS